MRNIDPRCPQLRKKYDDKVDAVERRAGAAIAKTRFAPAASTSLPMQRSRCA